MVIIMRKKTIFYLLFALLFIPINTFAITREEYNDALVKMATSAATTYQSDFVYTYRWDGTPENPIDRISLLNGKYLMSIGITALTEAEIAEYTECISKIK